MYDSQQSPLTAVRWLPVKNDSGVEVPGFAVLRETGSEMLENQYVAKVGKPSTTFEREYLISGPAPIPVGGYGIATRDFAAVPVFALYETPRPTGSNPPARGETWGPKPDEWKLFKWYYGFTIRGQQVDGRVAVTGGPIDVVAGKLTEPLAYRSTAGAATDIYVGSEVSDVFVGETVTSWEVQAYDWHLLPGESLDIGTTVTLQWHHGRFYATAAGCGPDV